MSALRKLLSMLLLAVFLLPAASPLFAMGDDAADAGVPICCRRNGKHHCLMTAVERAQNASGDQQARRWGVVQEKCPYCPATMTVLPHFEVGSVPNGSPAPARWFAHPPGRVQTECRLRIARDRARQKRGPPQNFLA